jgi:hypothetical protein
MMPSRLYPDDVDAISGRVAELLAEPATRTPAPPALLLVLGIDDAWKSLECSWDFWREHIWRLRCGSSDVSDASLCR